MVQYTNIFENKLISFCCISQYHSKLTAQMKPTLTLSWNIGINRSVRKVQYSGTLRSLEYWEILVFFSLYIFLNGRVSINTNRKEKMLRQENFGKKNPQQFTSLIFQGRRIFFIVGKRLNGPVERDSSNFRSVHSLKEPGITQSIIATKSRHS